MATVGDVDSDSEFGYDFSPEDEELLLQLASPGGAVPIRTAAGTASAIPAVPTRVDVARHRHAIVDGPYRHRNRTADAPSPAPGAIQAAAQNVPRAPPLPSPVSLDEDIVYPDLSRALSALGETHAQPQVIEPPGPAAHGDDGLSPLQRFRSFPRRPLTVSDLTSGAWCELQYDYTLSRLPGGRRTRTAAMRQGSSVHRKLEDEVHTTVKIDVMTKEDGFGLRLWNLVQGLRTLRDTGLTRELEVWGMVDGNVVNGVIDSLSYDNPHPEFERELSDQGSQGASGQSRLRDYFPPKDGGDSRKSPKIYLADVKTRGSLAPVSAVLLRPAKIQLLLYHRFLSDMAAGRLDYLGVLRRYGLDMDATFSDTFISQIGELHDEIFTDAPDSQEAGSSQGTQEYTPSSTADSSGPAMPDLLKYRSLRELLSLVREEIKLAFPRGDLSLGHMLRVQYVYRKDGRQLDNHDFPVSREALDDYLAGYMSWWRGDRQANGVIIEEAFKCKSCEFAADCTWRESMDRQIVQKAWKKTRDRGTRATQGQSYY